MKLPVTLQNKIVDFLKSLPNMDESKSQRAFIYSAGLDSELQEQISFGEPPAQFFPLLLSILIKYGTLKDGRYALEAVLGVAKNYVGQDKKEYCDRILYELHVAQDHVLREDLQAEVADDQQERIDESIQECEESFASPSKKERREEITFQERQSWWQRFLHRISAGMPRLTKKQKFYIIGYSAAVMMFLLLWVNFLDVLYLDTRFENLTMWAADRLVEESSHIAWIRKWLPNKTFHDEIVLVAISDTSEELLGQFNESWRLKHSELITKLTQAGAKVIAFDMHFPVSTEFDQPFAVAIKYAREQGTHVILGIKDVSSDGLVIAEQLHEAVQHDNTDFDQRDHLGSVCIGFKLGYARTVSLTIVKNIEGEKEAPFSSLALQSFAAFKGLGDYTVDLEDRKIVWSSKNRLRFSEKKHIKQTINNCTVIQQGDDVADMFIAFSPLDTLRDTTRRRYAYEDILHENIDLKEFEDKIVIVGVERGDSVNIPRGIHMEERYGFEIHADALNTIFHGVAEGVTIRTLNRWGQLGIMVVLSFLAVFVRYSRTLRYRFFLRMLLICLIIIVYFGGMIVLYSQWYLLLNTLYQLGAFGLTYWITGKITSKTDHESSTVSQETSDSLSE